MERVKARFLEAYRATQLRVQKASTLEDKLPELLRELEVRRCRLCWKYHRDLGPTRAPADDSASPPTPAWWRSGGVQRSVSSPTGTP
jgi:hypothetical protein